MELNRQLHMKRVPRKTTNKIISTTTTAADCNLFFFLNLTDATREGDAERLIRCFKFALLVEYQFRHTKYAYLLLHLFARYMHSSLKGKQCALYTIGFSTVRGKREGTNPLTYKWNT